MIGLAAVAAFVYWNGRFDRAAHRFVGAVLSKRWDEAYAFMCPEERTELGLTSEQFSKFCSAYAQHGWPQGDHAVIEEMIPYVPDHAEVDTSWNLAGTHRFNVTLRKPDGSADLVVRLEYRHNAAGDWNPDVFMFIFTMGRNTPHSHPVEGLLAGLLASGTNQIETYPLHQRTSVAELRRVQATHHGEYLTGGHMGLH